MRENSTYNEKYRHALKKTLDFLWVVWCHIHNVRAQHRRLDVFEDGPIEYVNEMLDEMQEEVNFIADNMTQTCEGKQEIQPGACEGILQ